MSYFIIPVTNLVSDHVLQLGSTTIVPLYHNLSLPAEINIPIDIYDEISCNPTLSNTLCNICIVETNLSIHNEIDYEDAIYHVNRDFDFLRINYCNLNTRETLIGLPGVVNNSRFLFFYDSYTKKLSQHFLTPYLYSLQPGIGLEIDIESVSPDDPDYSLFFSSRIDEVYLEHRTILSRACSAFHIMDLNRCFCYLFSTVERMGSHTYAKFQERKKRILGYIATSQENYDTLNHQFYFYSKTVRTEIIHNGKNITDFLPLQKIEELLNDLFLLIVNFCQNVILSGITTFAVLEDSLESKKNYFSYNLLTDENPVTPSLGIFDSEPHVFFTTLEGFKTTKIFKQGDIIYLPINCVEQYNNIYETYVYLDLLENHNTNNSNHYLNEFNLAKEFTTFSANDLDTILHILKFRDVQEMNKIATLAILTNAPTLKDMTWSPLTYATLCDIICDKISHGLDYLIISSFEIVQHTNLPPLPGISNSIRGAYMLDDTLKFLHFIPGNVYEQYCSLSTFTFDDSFTIDNTTLLSHTIFNKRTDEVALLCKNAISKVVDCFYISDCTIRISYMFDILDMLIPENTEGRYLKSHILPFIAHSKTDYNNKCQIFKKIRNEYRNPLTHHGKSIFDITSSQIKIDELFTNIKDTIISYCIVVANTNITSFSGLSIELEKIKLNLKL